MPLEREPGLRIPNMFDAALAGGFKALYCEGEDIAQSDPNTQHVTAALVRMECIVVQDIFLNETAKFAHVFLPGLVLPGEERHLHQRRAAHLAGAQGHAAAGGQGRLGDHLHALERAGLPHDYKHPSEIMDEIARLTPTFTGVSYEKIDRLGSIQWPCNDEAPEGTPVMHEIEFVRGKGKFFPTEYVPTDEKVNGKYPLILTTGRILSQYNVGAQTRRTEQRRLASRKTGWRSIPTTPRSAASSMASGWVS